MAEIQEKTTTQWRKEGYTDEEIRAFSVIGLVLAEDADYDPISPADAQLIYEINGFMDEPVMGAPILPPEDVLGDGAEYGIPPPKGVTFADEHPQEPVRDSIYDAVQRGMFDRLTTQPDDITPDRDEIFGWKYEVANGDTKLGLIDWTINYREAQDD